VVVDTSAIVAIMKSEPEAQTFVASISSSLHQPRISAVCLVEAGLVLSSEDYGLLLNRLIPQLNILIVEFDREMAHLAIQAGHRYGKGRGKKAQLNFGDCCSYATAKSLNMPLLFKGNDFLHTDVEPVLM
jgi:ribonuclease VapC